MNTGQNQAAVAECHPDKGPADWIHTTLIKEMKYLYSENFKMLEKDTEEETRKQKGLWCLGTGRTNVVKNGSCQKQSTDSMQPSSKGQCHSLQKQKKQKLS